MTKKDPVRSLEEELAGTLRPVAPRREFVHGLGGRITHLRARMDRSGSRTVKFTLLVLVGLLSLGLLVSLAAGGIVKLLGVRKRGKSAD